MQITKRDEGLPVTFAGFDGKVYSGIIVRKRRQMVTVAYSVPLYNEPVITHLDRPEWDRLTIRVGR